jgi:hypothetical protein
MEIRTSPEYAAEVLILDFPESFYADLDESCK